MKSAVALHMSKAQAQDMIASAIDNAPDLISAMESVGAMYGIPPSNILANPSERGVKVVGDTIVCPPNITAQGNTNTIVRSISSVLDEISKRVDDKINDIQADNIRQGEHDEDLLRRTDPSKGKVVITDKDANGDPVIVYDSGIIDCANNEAGRAKAAELRARENMPTFDPLKKNAPSYFNDEDDVRSGVDMECDQPITLKEYSLADMTGVHQDVLDAIGHFNDTTTLGYDIFKAHGFDCVSPTTYTYQESDTKTVNAEDLRHMKFDNKNLLEAVKYFNKARAKQPAKRAVDMDYKSLANDEDFKKAIDCIDKQFDCKLGIKWALGKKEDSYAGTYGYETEISERVTVSKSKGFQLNRMPIWLGIGADGITKLIPDDPEVFGQAFVGIILHEIFHNIARACRFVNGQFITSMSIMIDSATKTRNPKTRRKIVEAYIDTLNVQCKGKISRTSRKHMVREICEFITKKSDADLASAYRAAVPEDQKADSNRSAKAENELRAITNIYRDVYNKNERRIKRMKGWVRHGVVGGLFFGVFAIIFHSSIAGWAFGTLSVIMLIDSMYINSNRNKINELRDQYKNTKNMEEYYCDLFAAMYQFPVRFFNAGTYSKYSANEVSQKTLNEFADIEKLVYESLAMSTYPTGSERTFTGVTVAKKLLESKNLDPAVKKYCQWIVDNESNILKTNVEVNYNSHTFDPKEAQDLDQHLLSLVKNNKMTVTESYVQESYNEYNRWLLDGCPIDDDDVYLQEMFNLCDKITLVCEMMENGYTDDTLFAESSSFKATGYKGESILKRIFLFIPRLLAKLIQTVTNVLANIGFAVGAGVEKIFVSGKVYKVEHDITMVDTAIQDLNNQLKVVEEFISQASDTASFIKAIERFNDPKYKESVQKIHKILTGESVNKVIEIDGKDMVNCIRRIEKISRNELSPTASRITKKLKAIGAVSNEADDLGYKSLIEDESAKNGTSYIISCINMAKAAYNIVNDILISTKKTRIKPGKEEEDFGKRVLTKKKLDEFNTKYESATLVSAAEFAKSYQKFIDEHKESFTPSMIRELNKVIKGSRYIVICVDKNDKYSFFGFDSYEKNGDESNGKK